MPRDVVRCSCPYCDTRVEVSVGRERAEGTATTGSDLTGRSTSCGACEEDFDLLYYDTGGLTRQSTGR